MFLDMVIANAGIAISQGINGEEVFPVNRIQIVKKRKQILRKAFVMVFIEVFVLNKKHIPIAAIKLKIELIPKLYRLNETNRTPYVKKIQLKHTMLYRVNSIKEYLFVVFLL